LDGPAAFRAQSDDQLLKLGRVDAHHHNVEVRVATVHECD
jgi:hypothetical protein